MVVAGLACYGPRDKASCAVRCGNDLQCPSGLTCNGPGELCHGAELDTCAALDGAVQGCHGAGLVTVCEDELPGGTVPPATTLSGPIDTTSTQCTAILTHGTITFCVIAATDLSVTNVQVTGANPLVLLGTEHLGISGLVEAQSSQGTRTGPNADAAGCLASGIDGRDNFSSFDGGGAGGAGGTFGGLAGNGGSSGNTSGGRAATTLLDETFRGGCPGGRGGRSHMSSGTSAGNGGGAIYFISGTRIDVAATGVINASGGAGSTAGSRSGGAGGGSGGFIGLDAPTISIAAEAKLFALGGGGSGGGGNSSPGAAGSEPTGPDTPSNTAENAETCPGSGGAGSSLAGAAQAGGGTFGDCGGGGGGGGSGLILQKSATFDDQGGRIAPMIMAL
jgi:hypothetical protein